MYGSRYVITADDHQVRIGLWCKEESEIVLQTSDMIYLSIPRRQRASRNFERSHLNSRASQTNGLHRSVDGFKLKSKSKETLIMLALISVLALLPPTIDCQTTLSPESILGSSNSSLPEKTTTSIADQTATLLINDSIQPLTEPINVSNNNSSLTNNKLRGVNFTQVNELFEAVLSEDEVARKWKNMDAQIQDGIRSILKMLFPQIVAMSQDAKVSGECSGGILKWILSLRNLRSWAIKSKYCLITNLNCVLIWKQTL